nr:hypothetical protein [Mycolicibacterium tusciae]
MVALEGGPKGVTSNCINPAYVRAALVEKQIAAHAKSRGIPSRRSSTRRCLLKVL